MKKLLLSVCIMIFMSVSSLNISYAKHIADAGSYSCTTNTLDQCQTDGSIVYISTREIMQKFHNFIGGKNDKIVPYLYKGRLSKQFSKLFTAFTGLKKDKQYYYLTGSRYQSISEKGIAVFTEKGQMVGGGILYYPCAIPDHKNDCPTRARLAIYVKNIPQKDEVIANMKGWVNGIMQLDSFKRDNIHLEQVNVTTLP